MSQLVELVSGEAHEPLFPVSDMEMERPTLLDCLNGEMFVEA